MQNSILGEPRHLVIRGCHVICYSEKVSDLFTELSLRINIDGLPHSIQRSKPLHIVAEFESALVKLLSSDC